MFCFNKMSYNLHTGPNLSHAGDSYRRNHAKLVNQIGCTCLGYMLYVQWLLLAILILILFHIIAMVYVLISFNMIINCQIKQIFCSYYCIAISTSCIAITFFTFNSFNSISYHSCASMSEDVIITSRPFGGVCILRNFKLNNIVTICSF